MRKRNTRRAFRPAADRLEDRRLMTLAVDWLGQLDDDRIGIQAVPAPAGNDYVDVRLRVSGLGAAPINKVLLVRRGAGAWAWEVGGPSNAVFERDPLDPGRGDFYFDPGAFADPAGYPYDAIRVTYADGSVDSSASFSVGSPIDPNLRKGDRKLAAALDGLVGEDWTGTALGPGSDGYEDFRIALSNLSRGAYSPEDSHRNPVVVVTASKPGEAPITWQAGVHDGRLAARMTGELLDWADLDSPRPSATARFYASPTVDLSQGWSLRVDVTYWDPERHGKVDSVDLGAATRATDPSAAMPVVAPPNLPTATARSLAQEPAPSGRSRIALETLPAGQSPATVRAAVLSNQTGTAWKYTARGDEPYGAAFADRAMGFDPATGVFAFDPVRDEAGSTLTLVLSFDDGARAVARVAGAASDVDLRGTPRGDTSAEVATVEELRVALAGRAADIVLTAPSYTLDEPLVLNYPVKIRGSSATTLTFATSAAWADQRGALRIESGHVSLEGFAIRFESDSGRWPHPSWASPASNSVILAAGADLVGLVFKDLDIQVPASGSGGEDYEPAVGLMHLAGAGGRIEGSVLRGGAIELGDAPWSIVGNDYRGTVDNTVVAAVLSGTNTHDLIVRSNHFHAGGSPWASPRGIVLRVLALGRSDEGRGTFNAFEGNVIDGGIGTPADPDPGDGRPVIPQAHLVANSHEILLTEGTYGARFEGKPAGVSPDGFIVAIPNRRGIASKQGDVVSILDGPHAGRWSVIAQVLGENLFLLESALPAAGATIAIGRGAVGQVYRDNTIDLRGTDADNQTMVFAGHHWGTQVVGNTLKGGWMRLQAAPTQQTLDTTPAAGFRPTPWGWTFTPNLDLKVLDNAFEDSGLRVGVGHTPSSTPTAGRTYLTATVAGNRFAWTTATPPPLSLEGGMPGYHAPERPWVDPAEATVTWEGNWGGGADPAAARLFVPAAVVLDAAGRSLVLEGGTIAVPTDPPPADVAPVRIGAGAWTDADPYAADAHFEGGERKSSLSHIDTSGVVDPAPLSVYRNHRSVDAGAGETSFNYAVPGLAAGETYGVRLHFAEWLHHAAGLRTFDVLLNGLMVLDEFDVFATAGGSDRAVAREFAATADPLGRITLEFRNGGAGVAMVSGIEVAPEGVAPVALAAGAWVGSGTFATDESFGGTVQGGARYSSLSDIDLAGVTDPAPLDVYRNNRATGPGEQGFAYTVPGLTPHARYTVRLHFAEWQEREAGRRVFDVAINGAAALDDFDVIAAAGGPDRAVVREFAVAADRHGRITLTFTNGPAGAAMVSGIVVAPARTRMPGISSYAPAPTVEVTTPDPGTSPAAEPGAPSIVAGPAPAVGPESPRGEPAPTDAGRGGVAATPGARPAASAAA